MVKTHFTINLPHSVTVDQNEGLSKVDDGENPFAQYVAEAKTRETIKQ